MSCGGLIDRFTSGQQMNKVDDLWSDVPRMDDFRHSDLEMPLAVKLLLRTALNNLWRLNKEGEDKTPVSGDWVVFATSKTPADVQSFYTNDRMTGFGAWEASKNSTCLDGNDKGVSGAFCVFQKQVADKEILLGIVAAVDEDKKQTNVFFLRLEGPAQGDANSNKPQIKTPAQSSITRLSGSAPYGVEKRPMPSGTNPDELLPKQVGPYSRVQLEKSEQRGTTPTSIEVDGNSVYATYKNGDKEVMVEFSIASTPENAQGNWNVVVGDANQGIYPTDPRFGSFRTEPSYLKVVNADGAFFAWTRGPYFITANAKGGENDLDAFMNAYSY